MLSMQGEAVRSEDYRAFFVFLGLCLIAIVTALIYRDRVEAWLHRNRPKKDEGEKIHPPLNPPVLNSRIADSILTAREATDPPSGSPTRA